MAGLPTDPVRSALMKRVRRSGTSAELIVANVCRTLGIACRRNVRSLPGSPDLANKSRRWAIFVNGCFWHHHGCSKSTWPKTRAEFWRKKIEANVDRDRRNSYFLRAAGWREFIIWECEITSGRLALLARRIKR